MSEKHTPGPLTVKTDGNGFFWVDKDTEDGGFSVCNTGDGEEAEANANLFAAAPETKKQRDALLEACKELHDDLEVCPPELSFNIWLRLEAAIKQAEKE